jgi:dUTP pyrophosphatase
MNIKEIEVQILNDLAKLPTHGSAAAAGADLYAASSYDIQINPGQTVKVGTGIAMAIPAGYFGAIFARSGLATKQGLRPANCVGVVDSDYRGEIIVALHNDSDEVQVVPARSRIAQIIFIPYAKADFTIVDKLNDTVRGADGFGSTGTK